MTLSSFSLIYLSFYYVAVTIAFFRARAGTAPKARNSVAAMIIGAVGTFLIYISAILSPSGTVPLVFVAAMALVPVFLWGFGNLVGLAVATWRPYLPAQIALGALAIGLPLLLAMLVGLPPGLLKTSHGAQQPANQLVNHSATVDGRLGRYPVSFPASPQIDTHYTCLDMDKGGIGQCRTNFADADVMGKVPGNVPIFHHMTISRKAAECATPCLAFPQLAQWCRSRSDVTFSEWCRNEATEEIALSYDENRSEPDLVTDGWRPIDFAQANIQIACLETPDNKTCRASYDIARNLQVTIVMQNVTAPEIDRRVEDAQGYVARLWETMRTH